MLKQQCSNFTLITAILGVSKVFGFLRFSSEVKQHLLQPEMMLMLSTGRLLMAVARGSNMACCQILNTAVPMLTETHSRTKEVFVVLNSSISIRKFKV